ncbi:MAG: ABC transporter substrate-binding protein [Spirochaetales bacterium]|nr:ABC transporter substrate-binding protein [Spirochaetales bacterium]
MINPESTLLDIIESYPQTIAVFVSNGFPQMADAEKRQAFAGSVSLSDALLLKQMDEEAFLRLLNEAIQDSESSDATLSGSSSSMNQTGLEVVGLLPCPVRLPLLDSWNDFLKERQNDGAVPIQHELRAASMGVEWVEEHIDGIQSPESLPDLFISAGFDLFFDADGIGKFRNEGVFTNLVEWTEENPNFINDSLRDPQGCYSVIATVPAVFLVNTKELNGRPIPRTWEDVLHSQFAQSVSLPVGDFDLFNGILLNIHKMYGEGGVRALGRSLCESMHPSQMVKSDRRAKDKPAITIMPYFFTKMVRPGGDLEAVWPEDGAIISPIFMLAKKEKAQELQPVVNFFASKETGELLAHQGLFPSAHPEVDNRLGEKPFLWLGWDEIAKGDIKERITLCEKLFEESSQGVHS